MSSSRSKGEHLRTADRLSLVMLAVLLISVGVAWMLVISAQVGSEAGAEIVHSLRTGGLARHWSDLPRKRWYLKRVHGRFLGWRVEIKIPGLGGGFEGLDVRYDQDAGDRGTFRWQRWSLNEDATASEYRAGTALNAFSGPQPVNSAVIQLREGNVYGWWRDNQGRPINDSAPAHANYLPENTRQLAAFLAAQEDDTVRFRKIFGEDLQQYGQLRFRKITFRQGRKSTAADGSTTWSVLEDDGYRSDAPMRIVFDDAGRLLRRSRAQIEEIYVSPKQVHEHFPAATTFLELLHVRLSKPLPNGIPRDRVETTTQSTSEVGEPTGWTYRHNHIRPKDLAVAGAN